MKNTQKTHSADLIRVDRALESMRDSGFDLATASGELIDNSYQANADVVQIKTHESTKTIQEGSRKGKKIKTIDEIAFADNGDGIQPDILPSALQLGFSTRYGERSGLGRFGVGMKLASISQARRVDVYTRPLGDSKIYHSYIDLDEISAHQQETIELEEVEQYPQRYSELMAAETGKPHFNSGTLVIWSKVDKLVDGGRYGTAIKEKIGDLKRFIARAYRNFLSQGFSIFLDGSPIHLYDPLFILENPKVEENFKEKLTAEIKEEGNVEIEGHKVRITVTLHPKEFREKKGLGANPKHKRATEEDKKKFAGLYIPENEGKLSIVRNGREIYYAIIPRILKKGVQDIDRFIGIEVSFPAELDEYLQVRHVKRGAEPVSKLREEIRKFLERPIDLARKEVRAYWEEQDNNTRTSSNTSHQEAHEAASRAETTLPLGKAGESKGSYEEEEAVQGVLDDLGIDPDQNPEEAQQVEEKVKTFPVTIFDTSWPGKEMFEIEHLNGKVILRINHRHPLIKETYTPLKKMAENDASLIEPEEAVELAKKAEIGFDILFMAYAMAENMSVDPSIYEDLRSYWGQRAHAYARSAFS